MVGLCFPALQASLGSYCFAPFVCVLMALFAATHAFLPETKGRSSAEILDLIEARRPCKPRATTRHIL